MDKLLLFDGYNNAGPHIFPVELGGGNRHIKLATEIHPAIADYMAKAKAIPGKSQLLIDALGAGEWWGSNKNGDYFPHDQLSHNGRDYGYETFKHYAYPFKHHCNKDPARAYGDRVLLSAYHPGMHRVQLIVALHDSKCRDILDQVDNGEYPDVSMGCRVPYDQCSICGNRAKNRAQYCNDLRYRMNKILPDGRRVMAINWRPKFFDISFVLIGAEKASKVLLKVAHEQQQVPSSAELGERYYKRASYSIPKRAAEEKKGTMTKRVPMEVEGVEPVLENAPAIKAREKQLPPAVMNSLAEFPLSDIFSTLSFLGIDPKPEEFQQIILVKSGQQKLAYDLASKHQVFDERSGSIPKNASRVIPVDVEHINEKVAYLLRPYIAERSCFDPFLISRLDKFASEDQWYPSPKSTILASIPLTAAVAGLYKYIKSKGPEASMSKFEKALSRHPWLFGLLLASSVGGVAGGMNLLKPRPFDPEGNVDTFFGTGYNAHHKTAVSKKVLVPLSMAPLAYMYSGVQGARARRGERLGKFDRFIAERPDIAAIASILAAPTAMGKGKSLITRLKKLTKTGSVYSDFGLFALTSGSKMLPAAVLGAMVDATVAKKIGQIIEKKRREHGNPR